MSVSLKISQCSGEEAFLSFKHKPTIEKKTPSESEARPYFTVWARFCLDSHLYFPTAPLLTCGPGETLSACCSGWQHVAFYKQSEGLRSRNPRFSKTTISRRMKDFGWADIKTHIQSFSNKYSWRNSKLDFFFLNPRQIKSVIMEAGVFLVEMSTDGSEMTEYVNTYLFNYWLSFRVVLCGIITISAVN